MSCGLVLEEAGGWSSRCGAQTRRFLPRDNGRDPLFPELLGDGVSTTGQCPVVEPGDLPFTWLIG